MRNLAKFILHVFFKLLKLVRRQFFFPIKDVRHLDNVAWGNSLKRGTLDIELATIAGIGSSTSNTITCQVLQGDQSDSSRLDVGIYSLFIEFADVQFLP